MSGISNIFLSDSSEFLCPTCKKGILHCREYCRRIVRYEGGDSEWIFIPRHQCDNPQCRRLHRMLPDFLVPFRHYHEEVIMEALDDRITPSESDDFPSLKTVIRWKHWLMLNALDIDGHLKSIGYRELGFSMELLRSGVSLLQKLRSSIPGGWLKVILRVIYNSGARLRPFCL